MSTSNSWGTNRHITSPVSVVSQSKLVSGWRPQKRRSVSPYEPMWLQKGLKSTYVVYLHSRRRRRRERWRVQSQTERCGNPVLHILRLSSYDCKLSAYSRLKCPANSKQATVVYFTATVRIVRRVKVPILVYIERKGPELIPDSRQSACRCQHA